MKNLIIGLIFAASSFQAYAESVKLYMYHKQPPLVIDSANQQGLVYEVADLLNRRFQHEIRFEVEVLPRPRLNAILDGWRNNDCQQQNQVCDDRWVVFWVTPKWGWGANAEQRFKWVDLFRDSDVFVSNKNNPIDATSLPGHVFGAVRGHKYPPEIENPVQSGLLIRQDGNNEGGVLQRLANKRVDVTMIQQSALDYLFRSDDEIKALKSEFHIAHFKSFMLQVMIPNSRSDLEAKLTEATRSEEWHALFKRYDITL